jgi:hypothetical protein
MPKLDTFFKGECTMLWLYHFTRADNWTIALIISWKAQENPTNYYHKSKV